MSAIKAMELVKRYKSITAVDGLHLDIQQGELFSLPCTRYREVRQ